MHAEILRDFEVKPEHLVAVCDVVLAGAMEPWKLEAVGACLFVSEHFHWAEESAVGKRVADVVSDWVDPEINYDLSRETASKFRLRLFTKPSRLEQRSLPSSSGLLLFHLR
jgi:hypothetical protein